MPPPSDDITYKVATVDNNDDILTFIRRAYYLEEPITLGNSPPQQSPEDEAFSMSNIAYGTSVLAMNGDSQIVGVVISSPIEPGDADNMIEQSKECSSKKWSEILQFLAYLEKKANVCERYGVAKALHVHVLGVDSNARGKSIGAKLMAKCMEIGKEMGFQIASVDCTSVYSIRLAERLNMTCICETAYVDYRDGDGVQLFTPPSPHTHVKTFIKEL